jgi:hypothetical protein
VTNAVAREDRFCARPVANSWPSALMRGDPSHPGVSREHEH